MNGNKYMNEWLNDLINENKWKWINDVINERISKNIEGMNWEMKMGKNEWINQWKKNEWIKNYKGVTVGINGNEWINEQ